MRAREFLLEYRRDETAKRLGSKLVTVEPNHTDANEILAQIEAMDPTPNKKYTQWIAQQYITKIDGHLQFRLEDAPQVRQTLERFEQIKRNLPQKDIGQYSYYSLEDTVDSAFDVELQQPNQKPQAQQQTYEVPDDATVLYNGPLGLLAIPRTRKASCELGKGTSWCTARTDGGNQFVNYNNESELYIWHDKSGQKYQFHFAGQYMESSMQFMDQKNRPIDKKTLQYFRTEHPVLKKFFAKKEQEIVNDPLSAYKYARDVIRGRWPEAEPVIAQDLRQADKYAKNIIRGRWPEGEAIIAQDPERAIWYAKNSIGGRFPEAEPVIARSGWAVKYARDVIRGRWPEAEAAIAKSSNAVDYAYSVIKGRWPEAEAVIARDPHSAFWYAKNIIQGRFPEGEAIIAQNAALAGLYAKDVIRGRWPEAEPVIAQNPRAASQYAQDVIRGPWPEAGIKYS